MRLPPSPTVNLLRPLRERDFALLWTGMTVSLLGDGIYTVAIAWQVYQLSNANARWIGADLHDVELYLELTGRPDGIDVGGLLTTHSAWLLSSLVTDPRP